MGAPAHNIAHVDAAEMELQFRPYSEARESWRELAASTRGATLFHREPWLELLSETQGVKLFVASVGQGDHQAACLFGRSHSRFSRRLVALPSSDSCEPLATDAEAAAALLDALVRSEYARDGLEIRGVAAPAPWRLVECFADWSIDFTRPYSMIERDTAENYRRQLKRARRAGFSIDCGRSIDYLERFYSLQLQTRRRLGVPPQPLEFYRQVHRVFRAHGAIEIWIASQGGRDEAALVLLRDGYELHYKWGARRDDMSQGANHVLFASVFEHYAGKICRLNLGRADTRNQGLSRFKRELGGRSRSIPYAFYPKAPANISAEVLSGPRKMVSQLWCHLPLGATRVLGAIAYRLLA
jgi:hypothetical protein